MYKIIFFLIIAHVIYAADHEVVSSIYIESCYQEPSYLFTADHQKTILINKVQLRSTIPELIEHIKSTHHFNESGKTKLNISNPKEIWCLLQSLDSKLNNGSFSQIPVEPKVMIAAILRAKALHMHAIESDTIQRLAFLLTKPQERKMFLGIPDLYKRTVCFNVLSQDDILSLNRALLLPYKHLVAPVEHSAYTSPQKKIYKLCFSPKNTRLISISDECAALCIWDIDRPCLLGMFKDNPLLGAHIAFSQDDAICAISRGADIICFNTKTQEIKKIKTGHTSSITAMAFEDGTYTIISKSSAKNCVGMTDTDSDTSVMHKSNSDEYFFEWIGDTRVYESCIRSMARVFKDIYSSSPVFCAAQEGYAIGTQRGTIEIVKNEAKEICHIDDAPVVTVAFDSSERCIAGATRDGTIKVYQHSLLEMISPYQALLIRHAADHYAKTGRPLIINKQSLLYRWANTAPAAFYDRIYHLFKVREQRKH